MLSLILLSGRHSLLGLHSRNGVCRLECAVEAGPQVRFAGPTGDTEISARSPGASQFVRASAVENEDGGDVMSAGLTAKSVQHPTPIQNWDVRGDHHHVRLQFVGLQKSLGAIRSSLHLDIQRSQPLSQSGGAGGLSVYQ